LTLSVPIQIKRRSGRKLVTLPNGETAPVRPWDVAPTSIQLALARGHRWLAILESGEAKSLKEIATREGIDNSYRLAASGEIPAFKLGGTWRFRRSELDRWIAASINEMKPKGRK